MMPEVYHIPSPMAYHGVTGGRLVGSAVWTVQSRRRSGRVAAIIIEPVLGEGGFTRPVELLRKLRGLCDQHGILLIVDEIQTGLHARAGCLPLSTRSPTGPHDIAKSVSGGVPLSAVIGKARHHGLTAAGGLGGNVRRSPLAWCGRPSVLEVNKEEQLIQRANHIGKFMTSRLNGFRSGSRASARCAAWVQW